MIATFDTPWRRRAVGRLFLLLSTCLFGMLPGPLAAQQERVTFVMNPPSGQIRYIKLTRFQLCVGRGVDPWSARACTYWQPVSHGQVLNIRGLFCVYAQWDGNRRHRGAFQMRAGNPPTTVPVEPNSKVDCL